MYNIYSNRRIEIRWRERVSVEWFMFRLAKMTDTTRLNGGQYFRFVYTDIRRMLRMRFIYLRCVVRLRACVCVYSSLSHIVCVYGWARAISAVSRWNDFLLDAQHYDAFASRNRTPRIVKSVLYSLMPDETFCETYRNVLYAANTTSGMRFVFVRCRVCHACSAVRGWRDFRSRCERINNVDAAVRYFRRLAACRTANTLWPYGITWSMRSAKVLTFGMIHGVGPLLQLKFDSHSTISTFQRRKLEKIIVTGRERSSSNYFVFFLFIELLLYLCISM